MSITVIKAVLGMLARGTEARRYGHSELNMNTAMSQKRDY